MPDQRHPDAPPIDDHEVLQLRLNEDIAVHITETLHDTWLARHAFARRLPEHHAWAMQEANKDQRAIALIWLAFREADRSRS